MQTTFKQYRVKSFFFIIAFKMSDCHRKTYHISQAHIAKSFTTRILDSREFQTVQKKLNCFNDRIKSFLIANNKIYTDEHFSGWSFIECEQLRLLLYRPSYAAMMVIVVVKHSSAFEICISSTYRNVYNK